MNNIIIIDRTTGQKQKEEVYKGKALGFLYGDRKFSRFLRPFILPLLSRWSLCSSLIGWFQKQPSSAKRIKPFIEKFKVDSSEFLDPIHSFRSFNDFFIRKLKPKARPINPDTQTAIIPADGRYYFFQRLDQSSGFIVKGEKFDLETLLQSESLARKYQGGSMVMARLCPSDYHRFHFPCDCIPGKTRLINGYLYSVNPIAVRQNIHIFTQNKRALCELQTETFGKVLYVEVGATNVGSIRETYTPFQKQQKGAEKGYFEFGGSALILLFAKNKIVFDPDLLKATEEGFEIRCLLGQSMGRAVS